MNKLHIAIYQPPMYGNGLDRVSLNLAKSLANLDCIVDLVVPTVTEYHQKSIANFPEKVRTFNLDSKGQSILARILKLREYVNTEKSSILFSLGDYIGIANIATFAKRRSTKLIHSVHVNVTRYFESTTSDAQRKIKSFLLKWAYSSADGLVTVSKGINEDLKKNFGISQKVSSTIYNPVVTQELFTRSQESIEHPWFKPGEPPTILAAGRLFHQKDFITLVKAFASVRDRRECRLMIIGEWSPYKNELDALVGKFKLHDHVDFPGYVYNPYSYMANAALFVMSSKYEGFGNVLVEAMAVGTPVVSTDCESGPSEILENGQYGKLAPVEDAYALADAIVESLDNPISDQVLRQRALDFSEETISQQYLDFIRSMLNLT